MNHNPKSKIQNLKSTPDSRLQIWWNFLQVGLLIFPVITALGTVALVAAILATGKQTLNRIIRRPLNWGIAVLSIWLFITATFAFNRVEAFLGLANLLPFFLLFVTFSELIQTPAQLRRIAWILVISSVPVLILGFGQVFWGWAGSSLSEQILSWAIAPGGNPPGRMASVFMYANILAAYLQIIFILGLGLLIETAQKGISNLNPKSKLAQFIFLFATVLGSAIALILTNSRNGWGITALAGLAFAVYLGWRPLVAAVAGIVATIVWSAFGPDPVRQWLRAIVPPFFWARLTDQLHPDRPVALMRLTQWQFVTWMTQQRPWTGWGLRNFTPLYEAKMHLWLGHPHNLFLMLTAETGIPATILFCGLVGWVLAQAVLLLINLPGENRDKLIFFSYLVAFGGCILFNTVDVTIFDLRVNTLSWLLLASIGGIVNSNWGEMAAGNGSDRNNYGGGGAGFID